MSYYLEPEKLALSKLELHPKRPLPSNVLYESGDENISVTGGWICIRDTWWANVGNGGLIKNSDHLLLWTQSIANNTTGFMAYPNNLFDFSNYSTLKIKAEIIRTSGSATPQETGFGLIDSHRSQQMNNYRKGWINITSLTSGVTEFTSNISGVSPKSLFTFLQSAITGSTRLDFKVYKIWFE